VGGSVIAVGRRRRWWAAGSAIAVLVAVAGCSTPEPTTFAGTVTSLEGAELCVDGSETKERCFPRDLVDVPDDTEILLDDCVGGEVDANDRSLVIRAWWDGRCAARPVTLGVTRWDGDPRVVIPPCLGSLVAFRIEDEDGERVWSVARETSPEHPLLGYVALGEVPPGFREDDPWVEPASDADLTAIATQQLDLPDATSTFALTDLDDAIRSGGEAFDTPEAYEGAAGCAET
jgi:hypothetical protein